MRRFLDRLFGRQRAFSNSGEYWRERYREGGNSGAGSYNHLAEFKAEVLNRFVAQRRIREIIEFGSGDGNQLHYAVYPSYTGFDISEDALTQCRERFKADLNKTFLHLSSYDPARHKADLSLSLDVVFHLVEDRAFEDYMSRLFESSNRFVIVYSSDTDDDLGVSAPHVRHRQFTRWVAANQPNWRLVETIKNRYPYDGNHLLTSFADFFVFERTSPSFSDVPRQ